VNNGKVVILLSLLALVMLFTALWALS